MSNTIKTIEALALMRQPGAKLPEKFGVEIPMGSIWSREGWDLQDDVRAFTRELLRRGWTAKVWDDDRLACGRMEFYAPKAAEPSRKPKIDGAIDV